MGKPKTRRGQFPTVVLEGAAGSEMADTGEHHSRDAMRYAAGEAARRDGIVLMPGDDDAVSDFFGEGDDL